MKINNSTEIKIQLNELTKKFLKNSPNSFEKTNPN